MLRTFSSLEPADKPVCSVCIANFNGVNVLADCIDSVLNQKGDISFEIIIHDDASTDGSVEWIRDRYPCVELLAADGNVGFCIGNNRMVSHARGEFVLLLNNDAALHADALQTLVDNARSSHVSAGILTLPQYDWFSGQLVDRGCLLDPFYNPIPNVDPGRLDVAYVIGACMFMPRTLWNDLGGLPEWMESIAEDMYICCAARLQGLRVQAIPASGYKHQQGASFGGNRVTSGRLSSTYRRRALSERNKTAVMLICTPSGWVWCWLCVHALFLIAEGIALTLVKRDLKIWRNVYFKALKEIMRDLQAWRQRRISVQETRRVGLRDYLRVTVPMPRKMMLLFKHGIPTFR